MKSVPVAPEEFCRYTHMMALENSKDISAGKGSLGLNDFVNFSGIISEKLPNAEFVVELTHFPDGAKVTDKVLIKAKLTGKIRDRKIKIAVYDKVTVAISMESARSKSGFIIYRDRGKVLSAPGK